MVDKKALDLSKTDVVGLFRYLDPMWIKVIMETFEDLMPGFIPNPNNYRQQLQAAGIFVERMEVAMRAALNKRGRSVTWEVWETANAGALSKLPYQQRGEIKQFWMAGSNPGLSTGGVSQPPLIGAPGDWFVTGFSGKSVSLVVFAGFTAITGSIDFRNSNGDTYSGPLGLVGPSIGISYTPNMGKVLSKLPGAEQLFSRFPIFSKLLTASEDGFSQGLIDFLMKQSAGLQSLVLGNATVKFLLDFWIKNRTAVSAGAESWWSAAVGVVSGRGDKQLAIVDLSGFCVCYAVTGAMGPGNAGIFVLFFGVDRSWNPVTEPGPLYDLTRLEAKSKGVALISSASLAAGFPSLGVGATLFFGQIV
jgi:hypothetical protein